MLVTYERSTINPSGIISARGLCCILLSYGSDPKANRECGDGYYCIMGIGLLILIVGKRQNHYLDEIIQAQHQMTQEIHKMIREEMSLINEMRKESDKS